MWFLIVLGVILVAFLVAMLVMKRMMKKLMEERAPNERRFPLEGGKRALLLYQPTRHDTASRYAVQIAEGLNERGYDVTVNFAGESLPYDLNDYELLIFGTGAYMSMGAIPVRRYLRNHPFSRKQVVLFSVGSNLQADPEIEQMKAEIKAIKESRNLDAIPDGISEKKKAIAAYMREHPEVTSKSAIAKAVGTDRNTVRKYYDEIRSELGLQ